MSMSQGAWLKVILREGRKRQIREVGALIGLPVVKIIRLRIGTLRLGQLKPGEWRPLTRTEINELKGLTSPAPRSRSTQPRQDRRITRPLAAREKSQRPPAAPKTSQQPSGRRPVSPFSPGKKSGFKRPIRKISKPSAK